MAEDEVSFEYIKTLKDNNHVFLIDVRDDSELENTGSIPGGINIPLHTLEETLKNRDEQEFRSRFDRSAPKLNSPLVFTCQAGRRSKLGVDIARKLGFKNAKHYPGGFSGYVEELKR